MAKIQTFTAKMQRPGQQPRYIPNATIWNGYVVSVTKAGRGKSWDEGGMFNGEGDTWTVWERYEEILKPYFDGTKVAADGVRDKLEKLETAQDVIAAGMGKYLLRFGEQEGYTIVNNDEEAFKKEAQHEAEVADKKHPIPIAFGYFGIRIGEKIPAADWQKIKHLATYHKGDDDDLEWLDDQGHIGVKGYEIRGWYYKREVVEILTSIGYTVQYHGHTVKTADELAAAKAQRDNEKSEHYARVKEIKRQADEFERRILSAAVNPCSEAEAQHAATLERIKILDMQGPDIYGGGAWLHLDGEDLYYVQNNGMDGDDWSRNNYRTGGAGAICYRIPGGAGILREIEAWIETLGEYEVYTYGT